MNGTPIYTIVIIAFFVLSTLLLGLFVALFYTCKLQDYNRLRNQLKQSSSALCDANLVEKDDAVLELKDVLSQDGLEKVLDDTSWIEDATGLIPPCIAILKKCHELMERLSIIVSKRVPKSKTGPILKVAESLSPRVDNMVQAMYPPLDPRLLEAHASALTAAILNLILVIKGLCNVDMKWAVEAVSRMENKLEELQEVLRREESEMPTRESVTIRI